MAAMMAISGAYIVEFLAQDIIGMWIPRIGVSLKRGARDYNPETDPSNEGLKPWPLALKTSLERFKRLNWPNFWEEAGREFCTGPGVLMIPTLTMVSAWNFSPWRKGVQMAYGELEKFHQSFSEQLGQRGLNPKSAKEWAHAYDTFLEKLVHFKDPAAMDHQVHVVNPDLKGIEKRSVRSLVQNWRQSMARLTEAEFAAQPDKAVVGSLKKELDKAAAMLVEGVQRLNRSELRADHFQHAPSSFETGHAALEGINGGIQNLLSSAERYKDVLRAASKNKKPAQEAVLETFQHLGNVKVALSVGLTLFGGLYLYKLCQMVQHNKSYPANRMLPEGALAQTEGLSEEDDGAASILPPTLPAPARAVAGPVPFQTTPATTLPWPVYSPISLPAAGFYSTPAKNPYFTQGNPTFNPAGGSV